MAEQFFNCTSCGAPINEENSGDFCKFCGTKLPKDEAAPITNNVSNVNNVTYVTNNYITEQKTTSPKNTVKQPMHSVSSADKRKKFTKAAIIGAVGLLFLILGIAASGGLSIVLYIISAYMIINAMETAIRSSKCKHCKNEIGYKVKICPYCNHNQKAMSLGSIVLLLIVAVVVVFILFTMSVG